MENTENSTEVGDKPTKKRNPFKIQQLKEERERRQHKKSRIIVRNISYKATEEVLRTHFSQWGELEEVNLLKRADGKLVGCAFLQYAKVNDATKAILKGNNQPVLGRAVFVDWAVGKDEYKVKKEEEGDGEEKKPKVEGAEEAKAEEIKSEDESDVDEDDDDEKSIKSESDEEDKSIKSESDDEEDDDDEDDQDGSNTDDDDEDKKDIKDKKKIAAVAKEKHISNDVTEGCTVFIKNVPFDASDMDLRKVCRKYGPVYYAIINREKVSGHSKGTAFVKFKTKESADLCLTAGTEFLLLDQVLDPHPALSRDEVRNQANEKSKKDEGKDSRNLYLAREGLIMAGSKAADDVSASDMSKRHKLEQVKTQVLKNLNRFVSRNRLSIHNLPLNYDNEKLKQMAIAYTSYKPHECRVMRENKVTPEHPKGKSKGFGFLSFNTHQEALQALRKLNNNPKIFGTIHRPIVAFSIEDRAVHKIKEKRTEKSKLSNPTYQEKMAKRKERRKQRAADRGANKTLPKGPQSDDKEKLKKHIKKLEESRAAAKTKNQKQQITEEYDNYVGMAAKPGSSIRMRSNKKIKEQATAHLKRVKGEKKKEKQRKIQQMHLAERRAVDRPKQGRKKEKDDLSNLVNKYKRMIDSNANAGAVGGGDGPKAKKPKRTKWYKE